MKRSDILASRRVLLPPCWPSLSGGSCWPGLTSPGTFGGLSATTPASPRAPDGDADGRITLLLAHGELLYGVDGTGFHSRESVDVTPCDRPQLAFQP